MYIMAGRMASPRHGAGGVESSPSRSKDKHTHTQIANNNKSSKRASAVRQGDMLL